MKVTTAKIKVMTKLTTATLEVPSFAVYPNDTYLTDLQEVTFQDEHEGMFHNHKIQSK